MKSLLLSALGASALANLSLIFAPAVQYPLLAVAVILSALAARKMPATVLAELLKSFRVELILASHSAWVR